MEKIDRETFRVIDERNVLNCNKTNNCVQAIKHRRIKENVGLILDLLKKKKKKKKERETLNTVDNTSIQ